MDEVTRRTVRQDRRFLWLWLITATACSVAGNVGHALVEALMRAAAGDGTTTAPSAPMTTDPLFWGSVGWAVVPPILLMLAVHGLPTLARMLGVDESDTLLKGVVWGVVVAAFGWSAFGIYTFTVAVGVPAAVAWVAPVAIDLSVFGATRGLVKTAPLAARLKVEVRESVSESEGESHPESPSGATVDRRESVSESRPESPAGAPRGSRPAPAKRTVANREPRTANRPAAGDREQEVLTRAARGESQRVIAKATGISQTTVGRIINAARAAEPHTATMAAPEAEMVAAPVTVDGERLALTTV